MTASGSLKYSANTALTHLTSTAAAMSILTLSTLLSTAATPVWSMCEARKNSKRIYRNKNIKLTKCEVIFGANASGKSNLVEAFQFVQDMVVDGLPRGFTNKYFRQIPTNQSIPSSFKIELLLDNKHIVYEFSLL